MTVDTGRAVHMLCPSQVIGAAMTNTTDQSIVDAMALIDRGLGEVSDRSLLAASEVADLLLDLRTLLAQAAAHEVQN